MDRRSHDYAPRAAGAPAATRLSSTTRGGAMMAGEELIIMRSGRRLERLVAVEGAPTRRELGSAGRV
jgi:hypothetical protein